MKKSVSLALVLFLFAFVAIASAVTIPAEMSKESMECIDCHKDETRGIYQDWGESKHYRANVGCYECHKAEAGDADAFDHYDYNIASIVSPKDCAN